MPIFNNFVLKVGCLCELLFYKIMDINKIGTFFCQEVRKLREAGLIKGIRIKPKFPGVVPVRRKK